VLMHRPCCRLLPSSKLRIRCSNPQQRVCGAA
jgi:hypothetical protein